MMSAACPANCVVPPSSHGAGKSSDFASGWWLQSPAATVASAVGTVAACSKDMLSGIYEDNYPKSSSDVELKSAMWRVMHLRHVVG